MVMFFESYATLSKNITITGLCYAHMVYPQIGFFQIMVSADSF